MNINSIKPDVILLIAGLTGVFFYELILYCDKFACKHNHANLMTRIHTRITMPALKTACLSGAAEFRCKMGHMYFYCENQ